MAKVHRSYRIEEGLIERVREHAAAAGMTEGAAVAALLKRALDPLQAEAQEQDGTTNTTASTHTEQESEALVAALEAHNETLRRQLEAAAKQMDIKDEQIRTLSRLTDQAQQLHAITETKGALESAPAAAETEEREPKRGLFARIFG